MGDFTQPQQKYAGTRENCNIAIAVIFYPEINFKKKTPYIWCMVHCAPQITPKN